MAAVDDFAGTAQGGEPRAEVGLFLGGNEVGDTFTPYEPAQQNDGLEQADEAVAATAVGLNVPGVGHVCVHDEKAHPPAILEKLLGQPLLNALDATAGLEILEDKQDVHCHSSTLMATLCRTIMFSRCRKLLG